jgi:RNA polymerase sigma factor for flagellar operon FliA
MGAQELWIEYKEKNCLKARERLILEYLPLVKHIAYRMSINFPSHIIIDDITNDGLLGLIQAIDGFKYDRGIEFSTYATYRIRGAILDALRAFDWAPRSLRKKSKEIQEAFSTVENNLGRPAKTSEVASFLGMDLKDLDIVMRKIQGLTIISLDDFINPESDENKSLLDILHDEEQLLPEGFIEKKELISKIGSFIENLPYKEKLVITLYYYEELNLKEISHILNLSESRISQLHTKAMLRIKGNLNKYLQSDLIDHSVTGNVYN